VAARVRRVVFLGPPGAGKGTQAATLARELEVPHIATGDLLREAVRAQTPLGREADGYMRAGRLVPDDLVLRILRERLAGPDAGSGFLLDGFPRTLAQAEALARMTPVDRVLYFEIPEAALLERLTLRRHCPVCGTVYNLATRPPRVSDRCDREGAALARRADDAEEAVRTRLRVYDTETAPLLAYYRERGLLRPLDATGDPATVGTRIRAALESQSG
jgi:adenylate kinase